MLFGVNLIYTQILSLTERRQNATLRVCGLIFLVVAVLAINLHEAIKDDD